MGEIDIYTPAALLDAAVKALIEEKGDILVTTWFDDAHALAIENGRLIIGTSSDIKYNTLTKHFTSNVSEIISEMSGEEMRPYYVYKMEDIARYHKESNPNAYTGYSFFNFIVGPSNKFAHAAAYAVATQEGSTAVYNPLFIYGQSGLGKTHLLYAIAGEVKRRNPDKQVVYIKGDDFTNALVENIRFGTVAELRDKYRKADLLLVDDIQFIAGKVQTQEEFFHTFNTLHESGRQIVMTSDRPPKEIRTLEERLTTRFEWGLMADIQPPDLETRMAMINAKASQLELETPPDITEYIATKVKDNVRQIEGAVKSLAALHSMLDEPIDMDLAERAIKNMATGDLGLFPTPALILQEVSSFYAVPISKIIGPMKSRDVVLPRQVAIFLMTEMTQCSLPEIGKHMGRDHTTVLYARDKIIDALKSDVNLQNAVNDLRNNIRSH